ncbi:uncharacterized protein F5891DRAFT_1004101 [Suillus fuscotomentosus]|uniref:Nuclear fusion protein KAR5 n=1 Tax=Suillus fuscotomentosus TaxID=1912939 RepID=A0AAD4HRA1_9AGAM|nr:uncharacterized protein F5891DRAFT_1090635 [Suillus fuscotomentosus]XP_041231663.1 uncharacterized protein F5891DRAFT_1004101 [Suillus fuscotomentosus]KAG1884491.1 hypothetical protein F5891DRAFT_1090635 [Suillus fuscotomentosus]KAG1906088.1 hypothetical protein F5891DRAFT_1004101 [Suillus fuscotomentosus]
MAKVSRLMTFTFLIRCCIAWSWSRQSPDPSAKHDTQGFSSQMHAELSHEEIDLISKHTGIGAFDGYMRKNDCFQDAARHAQSRCEVSHMSEDERIQVAIRLTLCELATARHHTPPLECSPFNNNVGSHIPHHAVGDCVDALSRSAQFWSSYSGYLREIPQLCFAFRRWMEIDTAKDIYRNITMEKLALIRFFLEQQREFTAAHQNWERSSTDLRDLISMLKSTSGNIRDVADVTSTSIIQNAQSLFTKMETTLSLINQRSFDDHIHSLDKVDQRIDDLTLSHSKSLSSLLSLVESRLTAEIEAIASLISEQSLESRAVADQVQQKWSALDATFFAMQNSFYDLQSMITGLAFSLETSLSQAMHIQEIQREVAESVSLLDNRISQLTEVTHRELETINQTALALIDTFQRKSKHEAWLINLQWLLRFVEPTSLLGLKTFQAVTSLLVFLWRLLEVALSLLMTSVAVSSIRSQLSLKFCGSKQVQPQESSWRLDSHLETNVSPFSNVRRLQRNDCLDPRIIRRLTGPRISRIPDRICRRPDPY